MKCNEVAAAIHAHLCVCPRHGYTQDTYGGERWGNKSYSCTVTCFNQAYYLWGGDRDCSSSVIDAWETALKGTKYEGRLDSASWTGNIKQVFLASGLFEWHPMGDGFIAQIGDLYLRHTWTSPSSGIGHVAMCQSVSPDLLSEFIVNEMGTSTGGQEGDQTGWESRIVPYYNDRWDGILHYNHKADLPDLPDALKKFRDLDPTAWYVPYVEKVVKASIMGGFGDCTWKPDKTMTRAEGIVALSRKLKWDTAAELPFTDVGAWYTAPVLYAANHGIADPSNEKFHPDQGMLREELVTFVWRAFGSPDAPKDKEASAYAQVAFGWAKEKGIVNGRPKDALKRSEAAAMLSRI